MRKFIMASVALVAALLPGAVKAEENAQYWRAVAGWHVASTSDRCFAWHDAGTDTLIVGIHNDGSGRVVFRRSFWNLPDGNYPITLTDEYGRQHNFTAFRTTADALGIQFAWSKEFYDGLSRGQFVTLTAGRQVVSFSLAGTAAMLPELLSCLKARLGAANPFL